MDKLKQDILDKISAMPSYEIEPILDKKRLDLRNILREYHKTKDDEMVLRHSKRTAWLNEGHSFSRVDQMIRSDDELYKLKRKILELSGKKQDCKLAIEILEGAYWRNKGGQ